MNNRLLGGRSIYEKPLTKPRGEVSHSAFAYLLSEMVQYNQNRYGDNDLKRLYENGFSVGQRIIELIGFRERLTRRETRATKMLQFITQSVWKYLFNKVADNLEISTEKNCENQYMIYDNNPLTEIYGTSRGTYPSYVAGIIAGVLDSANFKAQVEAHSQVMSDGSPQVVFIVYLEKEVMDRELKLS